MKTIERLVRPKGRQILILWDVMMSQLVYVTHRCVSPLDFPAQAVRTGQVAKCTTMDNMNKYVQSCNHPAKSEALRSA